MIRGAFAIAVIGLAGLGLHLLEGATGPLGRLEEHYWVVAVFVLVAPALFAWRK